MGGWLKPWQNTTAGTSVPGATPRGSSTSASALRGAPKAAGGSPAEGGTKSAARGGRSTVLVAGAAGEASTETAAEMGYRPVGRRAARPRAARLR